MKKFTYESLSHNGSYFVAVYFRVMKYFFFLSFSSVGLAKAALEAINGFNLFGNQVKNNQKFLVIGIDCL
jgi:hypothetical protein